MNKEPGREPTDAELDARAKALREMGIVGAALEGGSLSDDKFDRLREALFPDGDDTTTTIDLRD